MTQPLPPLLPEAVSLAGPASGPRPAIRPLDPHAINRIAAGEVVERPASAVKELVENALDAGATRIDVAIAEGGRALIRVADDGCGIPAAELPLALARHATSKTDGRDLLDIRFFGFRGEALASLAAVARLTLASRVAGHDGAEIGADAGRVGPVRPAGLPPGTVVEVRDLFHATPARLKFLRTDRAEAMAIADALRRLAMAEPFVAFSLRDLSGGGERVVLRLPAETGEPRAALLARLAAVMGRGFAAAAVLLDHERGGHHLTGWAGLPAEGRGTAAAQALFVNGRPVKDRLLAGALKAGYRDAMAAHRFPAAAVFVDCPPPLVDVNVHPAKAEVRFRDPDLVRALVVGGIRWALAEAGLSSSLRLAEGLASAARPAPAGGSGPAWPVAAPGLPLVEPWGAADTLAALEPKPDPVPGLAEASAGFAARPTSPPEPPPQPAPDGMALGAALGSARAQLHDAWIVSETTDGLVLVDQHAAHERLVYERLKREAARGPVPAQPLLVPLAVDLAPAEAEALLLAAPGLARLGLEVEPFGPGAVALRSLPAALGQADGAALLRDLASHLVEGEAGNDLGEEALARRLDEVLARVACHGSVRSGRRLRLEEMDALLREMERTPGAGTCNHGRPTFVHLPFAAIERLFGRR